MKEIKKIGMICPFFCLSILICLNSAIGQPAMQYYNVSGVDFNSNCLTEGKQHTSPGCFRKDSCAGFSFPVNLPNGSTVKYVEMFFIRHDNSMVLNFNYLDLNQFEPGKFEPALVSIQDSGPAGETVQRKKSIEMNDMIDNEKYFYQLFYWAYSVADVEFCGARIYYYPPSSLSYLPLIKNK